MLLSRSSWWAVVVAVVSLLLCRRGVSTFTPLLRYCGPPGITLPTNNDRCIHRQTVPALSASASGGDGDDFTVTEVKDMEELIVSLSREPTDDSRRSRVESVFGEALARPNGAPGRFSSLFDQVLIVVGDRVKLQAQKKAIERQQEKEAMEVSNGDGKDEELEEDAADNEEGGGGGDMMGETKTEEEKQLWALVDMMVQSKTIVKKASGELGSEGSFG